MRMSVLATVVCGSEKMKHVDASAMHAATTKTGRPPSRHCATIDRPRATGSTSARNTAAKRLRHRLVVQGAVLTRRTMSPPLLQHNAAAATKRAPRRAAGVADVTSESGARGDGEREGGPHANLTLDPDLAAVQLDELPRQGQAQPGALPLGRARAHLPELVGHH